MKTNSVSLDSDLAAQLGDCTVGEEKQITLTVKVTGMDDKGFTAEVTGAQPYDETEQTDNPDEEAADTSGPSPAMAKAMEA